MTHPAPLPFVPATRSIGPVSVTVTTRDDAVSLILDAIDRAEPALFAFANAHSINLARRDPSFVQALATMTVFNDGIGIELASRMIHGTRFPDNLNGTDLTPAVLAALSRPTPVFLLGSLPGIADRAAAAFGRRFPSCVVVGVEHGFFVADQGAAVAERIAASGARLVLVGMGQPRQERWAATYGATLSAATCCIGAYLDFAAGVVPRAPGWIRAARLEWAFRLSREPRRLAGRYLVGNMVFMATMAHTALAHRLGPGRPDQL